MTHSNRDDQTPNVSHARLLRGLAIAVCIVAVALVGWFAVMRLQPSSLQADAVPAELAETEPVAAATGTIELSPDELLDLGIQTAPVRATDYAPQVQGYGIVTSLESLALSDSELSTAEAAARQSQAALERAQNLAPTPGALSRGELEVTQRQASSDAAALALAQHKAAATFGRNAPWLTPGERTAFMTRFSSGPAILVHATFPLGALPGQRPTALIVSHLDQRQARSWRTNLFWDAPADPTFPGRSFFAVVDGSDIAEGERVLIAAPYGAAQRGVLIPGDAVVLSQGQAWCFVVIAPGMFQRKPIDLTRPIPGGYFVSSGIEPGQTVVTAGTGLLLARQLNPSTEPEE
jgi:multidrug efflux pump subunit AcrA (membrane-fusion protein)